MKPAPFSVVVPAHDEERVIARCLAAILDGAPVGEEPEVIVAANGCSDRTAEIARAAAPAARVIELADGSKTGAMNEGSRLARAVPRFFVDADVECCYASLAATAAVLRNGAAMAASPAMRLDLSGCDRWVKAYYRVWMSQPYVTDNLIGGGVYGLSAQGLARLGTFPPVIGDDVFVRTRFSSAERRSVERDAEGRPVFVTVVPPRTLLDQIRVEARRRAGSDQVRKHHPGMQEGRINRPSDLGRALEAGATLADITVYLAMKAAARALGWWRRLRGRSLAWTRDDSSRHG